MYRLRSEQENQAHLALKGHLLPGEKKDLFLLGSKRRFTAFHSQLHVTELRPHHPAQLHVTEHGSLPSSCSGHSRSVLHCYRSCGTCPKFSCRGTVTLPQWYLNPSVMPRLPPPSHLFHIFMLASPCPTSVAVISSSGLIFHWQKRGDLTNLFIREGEFERLFHLQNILGR